MVERLDLEKVREMDKDNAEELIASAINVPLGLLVGLADLLIQKELISREEVARVVKHLTDHAAQGKNEAMVKMMLSAFMTHFEEKRASGSEN